MNNSIKFRNPLLTCDYLPITSYGIPFCKFFHGIFFDPINDNRDFPIHGPNVIRLTEALLSGEPSAAPGLFSGNSEEVDATRDAFMGKFSIIMGALGVELGTRESPIEKQKVIELLKVAALYHDIGKYIRRGNHPQIGANIIRNFDRIQQQNLVESLVFENEPQHIEKKHNRFSLISSIIQHHDKFGVVSTGEGGLPIFSDILYFTSDQSSVPGIKKNITSVMVLNLADIAAVNTATTEIREKSLDYAKMIGLYASTCDEDKKNDNLDETIIKETIDKLREICESPSSCLGIDLRKMINVLDDWSIVINAIDHDLVKGNRVQLKLYLLDLERNPARAIQRILRLLQEASSTTNCEILIDQKYLSPTTVESVLVGTLGAHQFQSFCEQFATVVKMDYALRFFQSIFTSCVRKELVNKCPQHEYYCLYNTEIKKYILSGHKLTEIENSMLTKLTSENKTELMQKITAIFVKVLASLIGRYITVLNFSSPTAGRFGFQMRDLTLDNNIKESIIDLLCLQETKDAIALSWIVDEVTIWSFD
ncbi:HD domain-containing protein [Patescibacteria group bacterium]|nr:HD domain-containing protein [Patescibacteria group bacterium]